MLNAMSCKSIMRQIVLRDSHGQAVLPIIAIAWGLLLTGGDIAAEAGRHEHSRLVKTGRLDTAAGAYDFAPISCSIHKEEGVDDIEVGGHGTTPEGEEF